MFAHAAPDAKNPAPSLPTVFVVDDDLSLREALSSLIRSVGLQVETCDSADAFIARCRAPIAHEACVVLDVRMPGMSGLDLQREMGGWPRQPPIVFITGHGDIPMTVRAIKAGAVEFLPKPFRDQDLLDAIQAGLALDRAALRKAAELAGLRARFDTLTQREREVLALLVQGLRNKQAADRLGISEVTVKVHRHNLMEKMQAASVPALLHMVNQLGA
ncbi:MAG: response regulator transcription factor [Burkholderiaceae bacterium]|nr:response regulator transcription factor [Burkholderiaceae bacterium]